ncbi:MAG: pyruvate kinase [Campylobacterota bacterium]|nr:pyruvate kinase [Campylobacterota bacterium]
MREVQELRMDILEARKKADPSHPRYQSLLNLRHYRILRSKNRTKLQEKLFLMSLSSLGRSYGHVAASIDTLYDQMVSSLGGEMLSPEEMAGFHHVSISEAIELASHNSFTLFGGKPSARLSKQKTTVMVTLPSYAAENDGLLIRGLARAGVRVFRINTAHDSAGVWQAMADVIADINQGRHEEKKLKIFIDLAGPKIRTGKIKRVDLPVVVGSNKSEKEVILYPEKGTTAPQKTDIITQKKMSATLCVEKKFYKKLKTGDAIKVRDANGKKAKITLTKITKNSARGTIDKKVFLDKDSMLRQKDAKSFLLNIERQIEQIRLFINDYLIITEEKIPGHSTVTDSDDKVLKSAAISCSLKGMTSFVAIGDKVFIDDGKIGLEVLEKTKQAIICRVTHAKVNGTLIKEEKGINFPDSELKIAALTKADRQNILSVIDFADSFSLSFCQKQEDVRELRELLREHRRDDAGIVAKIETKNAVSNMPEILEELLACKNSGVMIARGDLAIEVGFINMSFIQEELLDICNAAHMPVIWATQVLESQMKTNLPSRAEISDAALSGRAECVMLNKGPFAIDTIDILRQILHEMHLLFKKNQKLLSKATLW